MAADAATHIGADTDERRLAIEYAGICTLVIDEKARSSEVWLVDVAATGRTKHYPSLMVQTTRFVNGATPDVVVTNPGNDAELAVWDLSGTTVSFESDIENPWNLSRSPLGNDVFGKAPDSAAQSNVEWLSELGQLTGTRVLRKPLPLSARVTDMRGRIGAHFTQASLDYRYSFQDNPSDANPPTRVLAWRVRQAIQFKDSISIQISDPSRGMRRVTIARSGVQEPTAVIANLCRCPDDGPADHFYAYYDLLESPPRRPLIKSLAIPGGLNEETDPEHCGMSVLAL